MLYKGMQVEFNVRIVERDGEPVVRINGDIRGDVDFLGSKVEVKQPLRIVDTVGTKVVDPKLTNEFYGAIRRAVMREVDALLEEGSD